MPANPDDATQTWTILAPGQEMRTWPPPSEADLDEVDDDRLDLPDRYEDIGHLEVGGMSELRRVRDQVLGTELAMKILAWRFIDSDRTRRLFLNEARTTAQLQHPGIVAVQDCGELPDRRLWFTMSIVRGQTLDEIVDASRTNTPSAHDPSRFSQRRLLGVLQQIADVLAYAHSEGAVHRDIKPANIMIGRFGEVRVMDWGLATMAGQAHPLGTTDVVVGTPAYMAPEQARGRRVTPAADVFALGGLLFRVLSGTHPRTGHVKRVVARAGHGPAPRLPEDLEVHDALRALCHRCMAMDAASRPTAAQVSRELGAFLEGAQRRKEALVEVSHAREVRPRIDDLRAEAATLRTRAAAMLERLRPEDPSETKKPAWILEDRAQELAGEATLLQVRWTQHLRSALSRDPDCDPAHELLADHHRIELERAEAERDAAGIAHHETLLREHDRGKHRRYLEGGGALTLVTDLPVQARLMRIVEKDRRLEPVFERDLGVTPLVEIPLDRGSWLVELERPDGPIVRYPVFIERGQHWDGAPPGASQPHTIVMPAPGELDPEERYVPAGWCIVGGDPSAPNALPRQRVWVDGFVVQRFPVTLGAWRDWLQGRLLAGDDETLESCWPWREERDELLRRDGDRVLLADPSQARVPVTCIPWEAARRFAEAHGGRLPNELELEKAGRGVDGRITPWGDQIEASWSRNASSLPRPGGRVPVDEGFETDVSIYGVRGLAGNAQSWCGNWWSPGGPIRDERACHDLPASGTHRAARGGNAANAPVLQRLAARLGDRPERRMTSLGLRIVRSFPPG